jgi:ParB family chromosome partitioning protein
MRKSLEQQMRSALDRDARAAKISGRSKVADQVLGTAHAPRDITKPIAGMAREIDLKHVQPDPEQPRRTIDGGSLKELAESIKENGVLQPISVLWSEEKQVYLIIHGERRFRAAKLAKLSAIPALIRPADYDQTQRLQQQLVENIQREGIPPVEEARAVKALMETFGLSQRAVAKKIGKPLTYVAELLNLLKIPEKLLERGKELPKRALVEISRAPAGEQRQLVTRALKSDSPFQEVKRTRRERDSKPRVEHFRQNYRAEGFPATVTVSFEKHPDEVTTEDVVKFLTKVIQDLIGRETTR